MLALLGCDPVAPRVSGIVHVDSDLHPEDYAMLELRTGPADGPFDAAKLLTPDVEGVPEERWRLSLSTGACGLTSPTSWVAESEPPSSSAGAWWRGSLQRRTATIPRQMSQLASSTSTRTRVASDQVATVET